MPKRITSFQLPERHMKKVVVTTVEILCRTGIEALIHNRDVSEQQD